MNRSRLFTIAPSLAGTAAGAVTAVTTFAPAASTDRRPHSAAIPTGTPETFVVCSTARA